MLKTVSYIHPPQQVQQQIQQTQQIRQSQVQQQVHFPLKSDRFEVFLKMFYVI